MTMIESKPRRRFWLFAPFVLLIALAAIWTGLWFYAASRAEAALAGWRAREAKSGRTYECGAQSISGFPFRIEVRCTEPSAELRGKGTQFVLKGADLVMLAQVYQPTLLIGEFKSPMTVAEPGQPPAYVANWTLGQSSMRGTPRAPQRGSLVFDNLKVQRTGSDAHGPQRQADGVAWPRGGRLGQRQSGDRSRFARDRRDRARGACDHRGADRRRRVRDPARARRLRAEAVAGAFPGIAGAQRPHRHRQCAYPAGRGDRRQLPARSASRRTAISTASCR